MKTTIIIDAEDDPSVVEAFMKVSNGFFDAATDFMDRSFKSMEALRDLIAKYGSGKKVIIKHSSKMDGDARQIFKDAMSETSGFTVIFEDEDTKPKRKDRSFFTMLGRIVLIFLAASIVITAVAMLAKTLFGL
ncbi:MAG: hypothetical protein ILM98_04865 [Kiritimatiellae bacterium]|nr:hypothetical protein [Kiritimatiellia bacterium]